MMWKLAMAFPVAAVLSGCGFSILHDLAGQERGSGHLKTESRSVGSFDKIAMRGSVDCDVTVGPKQSVVISADDNLLKHVKTEIKNGTLIISTDKSYSSRVGIKAKISVPSLSGYEAAGSGDAKIAGLKGGAFDIGVAGSGDVEAAGAVQKLSISIAGSGDVSAKSLRAKTADVSIAGSGNVSVNASDTLEVSIAGSGDVTYFGDPKVTKSVLGSGDVNRG